MKRKEYKKIIQELIGKSFPKLKGKRIFVFKFFYLYKNAPAMVLDVGFFKSIWINQKKFSKFSKKEREAILIHELCHIERNLGKNFFQMVILHLKYLISKKKFIKEENETDKLVIKKGYGKSILSARSKLKKLKK